MVRISALLLLALLALPACAPAHQPPASRFGLEILTDGRPLPQYVALGTRYVEAVKGGEYSIRLHNPLGVRVAVALSVDGLNTIDARHTSARTAAKWVLEPYQTLTISGWQTNLRQARRFFFTSEERSYAQWMGQPENIGVIAAVYFRERMPAPIAQLAEPQTRRDAPGRQRGERNEKRSQAEGAAPSAQADRAEEYAATGIGRTTDHRVERIHLELEDAPVASVSLRYEYRAQLVRLGVLPQPRPPYPDPLARRQDARGFDPGFCPQP